MGLAAIIGGGVDTGWTFYTPYSSVYSNSNVALTIMAAFVAGFAVVARIVVGGHLVRKAFPDPIGALLGCLIRKDSVGVMLGR